MRKFIIAIALLVSASASAEGYRLTGPGASECFNYLDAPVDGDVDVMFMSWAQGFVTYHLLNRDMPLSRSEISNDFMRRNINKYCEANPTSDYYEAVLDHLRILNAIVDSE
jgi:hypothetical protein